MAAAKEEYIVGSLARVGHGIIGNVLNGHLGSFGREQPSYLALIILCGRSFVMNVHS